MQAGEDPLAKREIARATARVEQAATLTKVREAGENTLGALCEEYVDKLRGEGKAMSARDAECLFRVHLRTPFPHLTALPAAAIEPAAMTAPAVPAPAGAKPAAEKPGAPPAQPMPPPVDQKPSAEAAPPAKAGKAA